MTSVVSSASAGAAEFLPVSQAISFLEFLRESRQNGWTVVGTLASGAPKLPVEELARVEGPLIVVLGNEGEGLPKELAQEWLKKKKKQNIFVLFCLT